jgi:hypothetical protein
LTTEQAKIMACHSFIEWALPAAGKVLVSPVAPSIQCTMCRRSEYSLWREVDLPLKFVRSPACTTLRVGQQFRVVLCRKSVLISEELAWLTSPSNCALPPMRAFPRPKSREYRLYLEPEACQMSRGRRASIKPRRHNEC